MINRCCGEHFPGHIQSMEWEKEMQSADTLTYTMWIFSFCWPACTPPNSELMLVAAVIAMLSTFLSMNAAIHHRIIIMTVYNNRNWNHTGFNIDYEYFILTKYCGWFVFIRHQEIWICMKNWPLVIFIYYEFFLFSFCYCLSGSRVCYLALNSMLDRFRADPYSHLFIIMTNALGKIRHRFWSPYQSPSSLVPYVTHCIDPIRADSVTKSKFSKKKHGTMSNICIRTLQCLLFQF